MATNPVSGKVKAGSIAGVVSSALVGALIAFINHHAPGAQAVLGNPALDGGIISFVTGVSVFVSGYIAQHLPKGLVQDVEAAASVAPTATPPVT